MKFEIILFLKNISFFFCRLLRRDSEDSSVRCSYCSVLNVNENDLRRSFENTCTDSLVTAFDDEALLICDQGNEMASTKVYFYKHISETIDDTIPHTFIHSLICYIQPIHSSMMYIYVCTQLPLRSSFS